MSTREDLADRILTNSGYPISAASAVLALLAERGMVVLGPDGEPLDVRPALRSCGQEAARWGEIHDFFTAENIPRPLADACRAAAEVEP